MAQVVSTVTLTAGIDGFSSVPADTLLDCWVYGTIGFLFYPNGLAAGGLSVPALTWTKVGLIADLSATKAVGASGGNSVTIWGDFA